MKTIKVDINGNKNKDDSLHCSKVGREHINSKLTLTKVFGTWKDSNNKGE